MGGRYAVLTSHRAVCCRPPTSVELEGEGEWREDGRKALGVFGCKDALSDAPWGPGGENSPQPSNQCFTGPLSPSRPSPSLPCPPPSLPLRCLRGEEAGICSTMKALGIVSVANQGAQARMAVGMFDTSGKVGAPESTAEVPKCDTGALSEWFDTATLGFRVWGPGQARPHLCLCPS